jgi:hypothetical protein
MDRDFLAEWIEADAEAERLEAEDEPLVDEIDMRGDDHGD